MTVTGKAGNVTDREGPQEKCNAGVQVCHVGIREAQARIKVEAVGEELLFLLSMVDTEAGGYDDEERPAAIENKTYYINHSLVDL